MYYIKMETGEILKSNKGNVKKFNTKAYAQYHINNYCDDETNFIIFNPNEKTTPKSLQMPISAEMPQKKEEKTIEDTHEEIIPLN